MVRRFFQFAEFIVYHFHFSPVEHNTVGTQLMQSLTAAGQQDIRFVEYLPAAVEPLLRAGLPYGFGNFLNTTVVYFF